MGVEIERKFLVDHEKWKRFDKPLGTDYKQGYLVNEKGKTVRIRMAGNQAFITIKGATEGFTRKEFEYEIPLQDAQELLSGFDLKGISKVRYRIEVEGKIWEVDVFSGENEGLIVAEIELKSETETFEKPNFIAVEVTADARYYNSNLIENPYQFWKNTSE